jgi:hypothetical protein
MSGPDQDPEIAIPIADALDLNAFAPRESKDLVAEYLRECRARRSLQVRIVRGKGTGTLRRQVYQILSRLPEVESYALAGQTGGGWGATLVTLRPPAASPEGASGQVGWHGHTGFVGQRRMWPCLSAYGNLRA